MQNVAVVTI